jgi:hypothetical protein
VMAGGDRSEAGRVAASDEKGEPRVARGHSSEISSAVRSERRRFP